MFRPLQILCTAAICIFILSCRSSHQEKTPDVSAPDKRPTISAQRIAPNHCRLVGTVVSIDSALLSSDPKDPCSKVPCRATVRVDSVIGYGSAFPEALSKGKEVVVAFKFTTAATEAFFPEMSHSYPGVQVGSTFIADIEAQRTLMSKRATGHEFVVYGYEVK